ncbi:MAG: 2-oxoacid:acceptor oxidoreductase family protein [Thermotogota bacterium]
MKDIFNIYMIGVGGQGIGLLSEILIRAADYAGLKAKGVDTHGLAQRGGTVESHLRVGKNVHASLIRKGTADLVISLEKTEAMRGMNTFSKNDSNLIYYDTSWQTLFVRLGDDKETTHKEIEKEAKRRKIKLYKVFDDELKEARMQNIVILKNISENNLIPGIDKEHYLKAMEDLMGGSKLDLNKEIFQK